MCGLANYRWARIPTNPENFDLQSLLRVCLEWTDDPTAMSAAGAVSNGSSCSSCRQQGKPRPLFHGFVSMSLRLESKLASPHLPFDQQFKTFAKQKEKQTCTASWLYGSAQLHNINIYVYTYMCVCDCVCTMLPETVAFESPWQVRRCNLLSYRSTASPC